MDDSEGQSSQDFLDVEEENYLNRPRTIDEKLKLYKLLVSLLASLTQYLHIYVPNT